MYIFSESTRTSQVQRLTNLLLQKETNSLHELWRKGNHTYYRKTPHCSPCESAKMLPCIIWHVVLNTCTPNIQNIKTAEMNNLQSSILLWKPGSWHSCGCQLTQTICPVPLQISDTLSGTAPPPPQLTLVPQQDNVSCLTAKTAGERSHLALKRPTSKSKRGTRGSCGVLRHEGVTLSATICGYVL